MVFLLYYILCMYINRISEFSDYIYIPYNIILYIYYTQIHVCGHETIILKKKLYTIQLL